MAENSFVLSVITATYNAGSSLPGLIASLKNQTDLDFEWVVMDGGSTDCTLSLLEAVEGISLRYFSEPDFGIYHALNKALRKIQGRYYLVLGSDDLLDENAVADYKKWALSTDADIITAAVRVGGKLVNGPVGKSWLRGQMAYVTAHSVGSIYKRSLHDQVSIGYYARAYPIAADQLFILRAIKAGANVVVADFCAGQFSNGGVSSTDYLGALTEFFRVQMLFEKKPLQVVLFFLRFIKNTKSILLRDM